MAAEMPTSREEASLHFHFPEENRSPGVPVHEVYHYRLVCLSHSVHEPSRITEKASWLGVWENSGWKKQIADQCIVTHKCYIQKYRKAAIASPPPPQQGLRSPSWPQTGWIAYGDLEPATFYFHLGSHHVPSFVLLETKHRVLCILGKHFTGQATSQPLNTLQTASFWQMRIMVWTSVVPCGASYFQSSLRQQVILVWNSPIFSALRTRHT